MITYEVDTLEAWAHKGLKELEGYAFRDRLSLARLKDGVPEEIVFIDGGEPEDLIIGRDIGVLISLIRKQAETIGKLENKEGECPKRAEGHIRATCHDGLPDHCYLCGVSI